MGHLLKFIAAIVAITHSLRLVNAESDLLVFGGLAIILFCLYLLLRELNQLFEHLNSKL